MMMLPAPIKDTDSSSVLPDLTCQGFSLAEIQFSTNNFDETLVVGSGGFGKVYKSPIKIGSVSDVAVKRLNSMSNQGAHEFEAEVQILSKLRHGNLVSLLGYCNEGNEMVLIYEFMPNGTLEDHLHKPDSCLSWLQRLKICIGAARGLDYLHMGTSTQHGVIHRDVKSSNILLDANFDAKISDFGLAKIGLIDRTHVSTAVKGTFGYMDPCYFYTGNLTRKSDVYAFGVVLFEVLSGRKPVDSTFYGEQWGLAGWAQHQIKQGKLNQVINLRLMGQISKKCLKEFASIAGQCLHTLPKQRPTMAEVVVKLESILSQERENTNSDVDEEGLVYKLRTLFIGKGDAGIGSKSDFSAHHIQKSTNGSFRTFTYDELKSATNGFNDMEYSPALNEYIYKGWVNKRTYSPTKYGVGLAMYVRKISNVRKVDIKLEEFNHPNLVKHLGYCRSDQELFCVYELIPNTRSLDKYLYDGRRRTSLSWVARLKIAIGAAEGLIYLHKRSNPAYTQFKTNLILLDTEYNARLSDFAFGWYGILMDGHYAAPEYFCYQADTFDSLLPQPREDGFAMKNEIYAFGVVMLEILTGMKVYDDERPLAKQDLVGWATPLLADEVNLGILVDPQLQHDDSPPKGAFKLAQLVSNCLQPNLDERPSMEYILEVLHHCYQEEIQKV